MLIRLIRTGLILWCCMRWNCRPFDYGLLGIRDVGLMAGRRLRVGLMMLRWLKVRIGIRGSLNARFRPVSGLLKWRLRWPLMMLMDIARRLLLRTLNNGRFDRKLVNWIVESRLGGYAVSAVERAEGVWLCISLVVTVFAAVGPGAIGHIGMDSLVTYAVAVVSSVPSAVSVS